ncbi:MAG: hypothetical protein IJI57_11940 [Flexilinea sp.]|nr:hypothetical protein [Flexilinea sp.]
MAINLIAELKPAELSNLDFTYDLLSSLTDDELEAVQAVAIAFLKKDRQTKLQDMYTPFQAKTEDQLISRIDHSLEQIKSGKYQDAEEFEKELFTEIEL